MSEESRKKIGEANRGRKHTAEAREKIIASNRKTNTANKRPVVCSNGKVFAGAGDAALWLISEGRISAKRSNLVSCCQGRLKTAYGFGWKYQ